MMIATVFFLVISATVIFGLAGPVVRQQRITSTLLTSRQSYFLAEAGVEDVVYRLKTAMNVGTSETLSLGGNSVTTVTTDVSGGKEVVAIGDALSAVRKVETHLIIGDGVAFNYGIQVGQGGIQIDNNAGVNGNVYSNGNISGNNGAFITGDALAVGSVSGVNVGGITQTGVSSQNFPIATALIDEWKADALSGGTVGNQNLSGTNNSLGPKKVNGSLNLSNNGKLTVTGTLWITGNMVIDNNAEVALSVGYGAGDGVIVVDGNVTLSNGASFSGSGTSGSYIMILSTSNSGSAITLSNNAGAVILYAPNGTVELDNGAEVNQITAKTIELSNNATITYEQGLIDAAFTNGPSGGYDIQSWKEVE